MVEAGLLIAGDDIPVPYDRFRDRVMFPIADLRGRVIAFGGRALEKDVAAKYLNSPETPLFHKGDNLYNLAPARQAAHNGAPLVVVEGYVDVIAMVGAGFPASVAPLGTALTENQLALLWKMADEPILCFDGDKAGQKAAWRAADLALPHAEARQKPSLRAVAGGPGPRRSRPLRRPRRDRGSDRGGARAGRRDLVARDRGRHLRDAGAARGAGGADRRTLQRHPRRGGAALLSPGSRRAPAADLRAGGRPRRLWQGQLSAAGRRRIRPPLWRRAASFTPGAAGRFELPAAARKASAGSQTINRGPYQAASPQLALSPIMRGQRSAISRREALILQSLINHPWLLHDHLEEVAALELAHPEAHKLRAGIIAAFAHDHHQSPEPAEQAEKMRADLEAGGFSQVLQRVERAITTSAVWGAQPARRARTFFPPGTSWSPCIANGTPYLGN